MQKHVTGKFFKNYVNIMSVDQVDIAIVWIFLSVTFLDGSCRSVSNKIVFHFTLIVFLSLLSPMTSTNIP